MMRWLLVLLGVAYLVWRWRQARDRLQQPPPAAPPPPTATGAPVAMVACAHCGLHVPAEAAITVGKAHYCCPEHGQQHR